ncbi:unnamed protein product [marine sediment metagenome]|uniref:Uncharacterized protein n=1 Tax=marine sediment metagenome TaxID=412755 RepID=X0UH34_9ZZZZ
MRSRISRNLVSMWLVAALIEVAPFATPAPAGLSEGIRATMFGDGPAGGDPGDALRLGRGRESEVAVGVAIRDP